MTTNKPCMSATLTDQADVLFLGGVSFGGGDLLYPHFLLSSTDLSHFILNLLMFDIYFLLYSYFYIYLFGRLGANRPLSALG